MDFFTCGSIVVDYKLINRRSGLKLKRLNDGFVSYMQLFTKTLNDGLEWCGLLVNYFDVFISSLDSRSDGTHSLQMIHLWASDVMLHFSHICWRNNLTYWIAWGWVNFQQTVIFGWIIILSLVYGYDMVKFKTLCEKQPTCGVNVPFDTSDNVRGKGMQVYIAKVEKNWK